MTSDSKLDGEGGSRMGPTTKIKRSLKRLLRPDALASRVFFPHQPLEESYVLEKVSPSSNVVPPREHWISDKYGKNDAEYLASGLRDFRDMQSVLAKEGVTFESFDRILDFGCGDGRMIRQLKDQALKTEVWGVDVHASRIYWCLQNLGKPLNFMTTTLIPHLPFCDGYFSFVYAGSVFSHIDDLAFAWFAELARITRPGGKLFITVHLRRDIEVIEQKHPGSTLASRLRTLYPEHARYVNSEFDLFTCGRSTESYVFYDEDFLRAQLAPFYRVLSVTPEVRLYQNGLLLERL